MRKHDCVVGTVVGFKSSGDAVGKSHWVAVCHSLVVVGNDETVRICSDTDYGKSLAVEIAYDVWFDKVGQCRFFQAIVGVDYGKFHTSVVVGERFDAVVKLMVSDGRRVVAHAVHHFIFHLAFEQREIHLSLHVVAGIEQHNVGFCPADAVDRRFHAYHSSRFRQLLWTHVAVHIVCVENHKVLRHCSRGKDCSKSACR